jgi:hypothetical protein
VVSYRWLLLSVVAAAFLAAKIAFLPSMLIPSAQKAHVDGQRKTEKELLSVNKIIFIKCTGHEKTTFPPKGAEAGFVQKLKRFYKFRIDTIDRVACKMWSREDKVYNRIKDPYQVYLEGDWVIKMLIPKEELLVKTSYD